VQIFVDVIAADGAYVACEQPVPAAVGVGKVVPVACRFALELGREVNDRMAVYHVEEMRFLEWPGFTETAVRDLDTLIVVASADPSFESGKNLEGLWLVAAGLGRRARVEAERRAVEIDAAGDDGRPVNNHVVERLESPASRPARLLRHGRSATEIAFEAALDEALDDLADDIPDLQPRVGLEEVTRVEAEDDGDPLDSVLWDLGDTADVPALGDTGTASAVGSSVRSRDEISRSSTAGSFRAHGSSPNIRGPATLDDSATAPHDSLGAIEPHDSMKATEAHQALDDAAMGDPVDDAATRNSIADATATRNSIADATATRDSIADATATRRMNDDAAARRDSMADATVARDAIDDAIDQAISRRPSTGVPSMAGVRAPRRGLDAAACLSAVPEPGDVSAPQRPRRLRTLEREIDAAIESAISGLASPAELVRPRPAEARRSGRAPTFIDAAAAARAETELVQSPEPAPAPRRKPRTRPPKPPPGRRRRAARSNPPTPPRGRRARGPARAPTHL